MKEKKSVSQMCCHGHNINDFKKYQVEKVTVLRIIINGPSNFHFNITIISSSNT